MPFFSSPSVIPMANQSLSPLKTSLVEPTHLYRREIMGRSLGDPKQPHWKVCFNMDGFPVTSQMEVSSSPLQSIPQSFPETRSHVQLGQSCTQSVRGSHWIVRKRVPCLPLSPPPIMECQHSTRPVIIFPK